ncbi:MAG TPA: hypothetical protein VMW43_08245 [Bacteroidota bacterium]|nr:hypothetical protein [Bacteroidota bacterium]
MARALCALLLLALAGCSSPPPPDHDYPMGPLTFAVRGSSLHGTIPAGWFVPASDTLTPALDAWLVREDFSASISLREISPDAESRRRIAKEGMILLASMSMAFRDAGTIIPPSAPPSVFRIHEREFGRYETDNSGCLGAVVVFTHGGKYYECEARQHKQGLGEEDMAQLRRAQLAVLFSLVE